jgi:hypothetical protein
MLQIGRDLLAAPDAAHGGHQAQGLVRLDHGEFLRSSVIPRPLALVPG